MGWSSGTEVFDAVCSKLLDKKKIDPEEVLRSLVKALEDRDWDCHSESSYFNHPVVRKIFEEEYPDWYKED